MSAYKKPVPPIEEQRGTLLTGSKEGYRVGEISEDLGLISAKGAIAATDGHWLRWRRGGSDTICFEKGITVSEDQWGLRDREKRTLGDLRDTAFYVQAHENLDGKPAWANKKSAVRSAKLAEEQVKTSDVLRLHADGTRNLVYKGSQTFEVCVAAPPVGPSTRFLTIRTSLYTDGQQLYIWRVQPLDGESPAVAETEEAGDTDAPNGSGAPTDGLTLMAALEAAGKYKTLVGLIIDADVDVELDAGGPFTILAPTDDAFAKWPAKRRDKLFGNKEKLTRFVRSLVLVGAYPPSPKEKRIPDVRTLGTDTRGVATWPDGLLFRGTTLKTLIRTSNGLVYQLDEAPAP